MNSDKTEDFRLPTKTTVAPSFAPMLGLIKFCLKVTDDGSGSEMFSTALTNASESHHCRAWTETRCMQAENQESVSSDQMEVEFAAVMTRLANGLSGKTELVESVLFYTVRKIIARKAVLRSVAASAASQLQGAQQSFANEIAELSSAGMGKGNLNDLQTKAEVGFRGLETIIRAFSNEADGYDSLIKAILEDLDNASTTP